MLERLLISRSASSILLLPCLFFLGPVAATAADGFFAPRQSSASFGVFGLDTQDETVAEVGVELVTRGRIHRLFGEPRQIEPTFGLIANRDGGLYGYVGFRVPIEIGPRWSLIPQVAAGFYDAGSGPDLGGSLEFRSGLELSRDFGDQRLGLLVYHLSNAGLYELNPGVESLVVTWSFPVGR